MTLGTEGEAQEARNEAPVFNARAVSGVPGMLFRRRARHLSLPSPPLLPRLPRCVRSGVLLPTRRLPSLRAPRLRACASRPPSPLRWLFSAPPPHREPLRGLLSAHARHSAAKPSPQLSLSDPSLCARERR